MTIDSSIGGYTGDRRFTRRSSSLAHKPNTHPAKITVNHWQLRDLVQPSSRDTNEILYTHESAIKMTDRSTGKMSTTCELDFHPRCFKEAHDKIVSGGVISSVNANNSNSHMNRSFSNIGDGQSGQGSTWRGLFSFYNRETQESMSIRLGSYINNNASISKIGNSEYSSFVCNNDMSIYNTLITPSSIVVNSSLPLDFPLNHSDLSDDRKNLVVVGDSSNIVFLHPGQEDSTRIHRDQVIETGCDSGFSTSFDQSGLHFASCFQDGTCLIYDTRNVSAGPMDRIYSTRRNSSSGALRCVKYSRGTDDLLLISEHVGRVHVVDTRDFNNHQVIVLPFNTYHRPRSGRGTTEDHMDTQTGALAARVMEYSDILSLEHSDVSGNSYASRNLNNFGLLNAMDSEALYDSDMEEDAVADHSFNRTRESGASFDSAYSEGSEYVYDKEICGVDWFEDREGSHVIIGHETGLLSWNIDTWSRRTFPSFHML
ncbi:hypothetical protein BON22_0511 [Cyberlindnera fabianii]|uniref:DUF2415 domain-containing protein n=1 Tax=Cyberlindnera fabianii TaxID=36022 RepID=A0A1V2LE55_CYBFA|nr:hypothetical protein BON22_0511 [Cyberlindnera fabianii]